MTALRLKWPALPPRRFETHLGVVFGFTVILALVGIILYVNNRASAILDDTTQAVFEHVTSETSAHIDKNFSTVDTMTRLFADDSGVSYPDTSNDTDFIKRAHVALSITPFISAIYTGYDNGDFILLRHLASATARTNLSPPDGTDYLLESIQTVDGRPKVTFTFLDKDLRRLGSRDPANFQYDPRTRDWFLNAKQKDGAQMSEPYRFSATQEPGVTVSRRLQSGRGVVGIDLGLADLSQHLQRMKPTASSRLLIVSPSGAIIASADQPTDAAAAAKSSTSANEGDASSIEGQMLAAARAGHVSTETATVSAGDRTWVMRVVPLQAGAWAFRIAQAVPQDEILTSARHLTSTLGWVSLALILAVIVAVRMTARAVSRPLVAIAKDANAIRSFRFDDAEPTVASSVTEVHALSHAIQNARATIGRFVEIGRTLAAERDPDRLVERLLQESVSIAGARGGLILLTEDNGQTFVTTGGLDATGEPRVVLTADATGASARIFNALRDHAITHFEGAELMADGTLHALTRGMALDAGQAHVYSVVPMLNRANETIGGMLLVSDRQAQYDMSDDHLELVRAVAGIAAVAIETTMLLKSRKTLLDAVIRMIAQAIDAKSPYTSGHCGRVPIITQMLARAACDTKQGHWADFDLSAEQWEAVEVASWLHDCGKLATSEYVVDKATKLETISDRIHEIRMRFEVLKAAEQIRYWQGVAQGGDEAALREARDRELAALDDDFAFVASCNEGGEFISPEQITRLKSVGARQWTRTLDDRIGISTEEKRRKDRVPAAALPVQELLLADQIHHIVDHFPSELGKLEERKGFKMVPPEHRMNLGELYNLSISRGTLTPEERFEINRHITRTIVMLDELPFSGVLRQVPEFAGGHHEKMDGSGYPRGLRREQMSVVARIMAIADVFEALTAADRPYKKAKPLSEAIRIMGFMKRDHHLDPDLLDLFLRSGIWKDYAKQFLEPAQIDEPDIEGVLAIRPS